RPRTRLPRAPSRRHPTHLALPRVVAGHFALTRLVAGQLAVGDFVQPSSLPRPRARNRRQRPAARSNFTAAWARGKLKQPVSAPGVTRMVTAPRSMRNLVRAEGAAMSSLLHLFALHAR